MLSYVELIKIIFIVGAAQGVILAIFLFNKKENKTANRLLALTMIAFTIDLTSWVLLLSGYGLKLPELMGIPQSFPYLYGPCIYLYTVLLGHKKEGFKKSYYLHFIPFILMQLYGIFFFYFEDFSYKMALIDLSIEKPWHLILVGKLIPVHGCTYVIFTLIEAVKINRRLKNSYSNLDKINLNWLTYLVGGTTVVWFVVIVSYVINAIYGEESMAGVLIYIALSLLLYTLGIKSLKQPEVILYIGESSFKEGDERTTSYQKSGLAPETAENYLNKLIEVMDKEKPYLNERLNLPELSKMVDISTHNLSEVINTKLNQNFYDFINKYRVEEVIRLIKEDINFSYSILSIGFDAGFSSKSVFYNAFKKVTGITPAQYRKEMNKQKAA